MSIYFLKKGKKPYLPQKYEKAARYVPRSDKICKFFVIILIGGNRRYIIQVIKMNV